ncbi:hypothetical protein [Phytohabitans kaempferiae]|uniref:Uncharacterized protein n=1 Tax=Phytohabitans kaempferiae TaxID=1620943 RepID=A0ABV6M0B7_9ACTN
MDPLFLARPRFATATSALPVLEGELLAGLYPAVVLALAGVLVVTAAVRLRSRPEEPTEDRAPTERGERAAPGDGPVPDGVAAGHAEGVGHIVIPFAGASAVTLLTLVAVHGAAFLAPRRPGVGLAAMSVALVGTAPRLLSWLAVPLVPVLLSFQVMSWWIFRGRIGGRDPVYW